MNNIPDEFICPITLDIMDDPVLCEDGYTYERTAIKTILNSLSPMTRQHIDKTKLVPNRGLKNEIIRFKESNSQNLNTKKIIPLKERREKEKREKERLKQIERDKQEKLRQEDLQLERIVNIALSQNPQYKQMTGEGKLLFSKNE
jgi:hypothetical protein